MKKDCLMKKERKLKKRIFAAVALACSMLAASLICVAPAQAEEDPASNIVFHQNKTSMKLGEAYDFSTFSYENALPGTYCPVLYVENDEEKRRFSTGGVGGDWPTVPSSGSGKTVSAFTRGESGIINNAIKPGKVNFNAYFYSIGSGSMLGAENYKTTMSLEIEEPVIETNLEPVYYVGEQIDFKTELGNTAFSKGEKIEPDSGEYTYQANTQIIEGQDIVTKENENYDNSLESSERLTFTGIGTVKIKVTYNPIYHPRYSQEQRNEEDYYHGEKIVTINVTTKDAIKENENYKQLNNKISEFENLELNPEKFTPESWLSYTTALANTKQVLAKERLTEEDCINALNMLISAKENLVAKSEAEGSTEADKETGADKGAGNEAPATGDSNIALLWIMLMICAAVSGIMMLRRKESSSLIGRR